ncbi:mechanosensitive ion channel family protein [bacterium]|nr:MAG: mechanosensitive ion channel family protein [bacterium]
MDLGEIAVPLIVFAALFVFGLGLRKLLLKALRQWTKEGRVGFEDKLIRRVRRTVETLWLLFCLFIALTASSVPQDITELINKIILAVSIALVTFTCAHLAVAFIRKEPGGGEPAEAVASLIGNVAKIAIFACGGLIILSNLGISITPLLAALGVGGLAVALALQDTLSNLFAGLQITFARQVRIGDYIKIEAGQEGYVEDINWRSTKIKTLANNMVIVPNAKLTQSIVTNYSLPDRELAVTLEVGVHYDSDLDRVERVTAEVAREVMKESAAASSFEPFMRYNQLGEYSVNFTVILRAKEFTEQYLIKHEFIKRLHKRYKEEGIIIPYPVRAINYAQEKSGG